LKKDFQKKLNLKELTKNKTRIKMKNIFFLIVVIATFTGCSKPFPYKYQDSKQIIECKGLDNDLAHEAYYSFREDIALYAYKNHFTNHKKDYNLSLGYFIYNGAAGIADFKNIVSPHTLTVLEKLKQNDQLWESNSKISNTNYHSEFIDCLIQNIKNSELKETILSLRGTNSLSPKILSEKYRILINEANDDEYFAMFIAFETYYQYLYDIDFSEKKN